jgi:CheY-like chemotaxis protein
MQKRANLSNSLREYKCPMRANKFTLLIVDDDENDRFFLEKTFHKLGTEYRIHAMSDAEQAVAYIKGEGKYADRNEYQFPSYIITDLKMAPRDGFYLLDYIKKHPALSIIPVVMLSSSEDCDDIRHAYLLGASSYFTKARDLDSLTKLLKKIHEYWAECQVPAVDQDGYALMTNSHGKAGEQYCKPVRPEEDTEFIPLHPPT